MDSETELISGEITKLLDKGVIVESDDEIGQYVSPIFLRPKKDGNHLMILNLKQLNNTVAYQHFKIHTGTSLMSPNCYLSRIDLSNAYYTVPVFIEFNLIVNFVKTITFAMKIFIIFLYIYIFLYFYTYFYPFYNG